MASVETVAIVGGGIGGMTLAVALRQKGVRVRVIEKCRPEDQLGTGINLQNNALRALRDVGVLRDCVARGYGWNTVTNCDGRGNVVHRVNLPWADTPEMPGALGIMRTDLADVLADHAVKAGAELTYGMTVEDLDQSDDRMVSLKLSDGTSIDADLVVAADGVYSGIRRRAFGDDHVPSYAGQGVWRYTLPRPADRDGFTLFRTANGETVGCLPLSNELCYYFYLESSVERPRLSEQDLPDALAERLSAFEVPELEAAVAAIHDGHHISFRPFDVLLMPQPWHRGRVVLLGDAAHSLTPQLTSGGGMAVEDAVVLAEELASHANVAAALDAYGTRRAARVATIFNNSFQICELEKAKSPDGAEGTRLMIESFKILADPY
jgi:2-polyprenyl-6-methoxyphenol hydroxylase-like FAD-dependent oxidoreductase